MATFSAISKLDQSLVRKALTGSLFVAPYSAVAITRTNLFSAGPTPPVGELVATLPTGYVDGGYTTDEGIRFARSQDSEAITGWQSLEPVREDRTSDSETLQVDFEQTTRQTIELYTGADLSAATNVNGAISVQKPRLPQDRYFRLLALAVDNVNGKEFYVARFYPRCKVTGWADQAFSKGGSLNWGMTFSTFVDPVLQYSKDDMIGGPGYADLDVAMGFPNVA